MQKDRQLSFQNNIFEILLGNNLNYIYDSENDMHYGFIDGAGNQSFDAWEGGNTLGIGFDVESIPSEPCFAGLGGSSCNENSTFIPAQHDCGLDGFCPDDVGWPGADYGEGNGV